MEDDKKETVNQFSGNVYSETFSDFKISANPDSKAGWDNDTDPFSSNIAVLQARIAAAEARESAGFETDESINVLKARQALVEAKTSLESEEDIVAKNTAFHSPSPSESNQAQVLTASRIPQPRRQDKPLANFLQFSSSVCAVLGGVLLSSNTSASKYGFILLACSSSQIFLSSLLLKQKNLMIYGASVFILVDCLGIYRWLLQAPI